MNDMRQTEAGGLRATWRLFRNGLTSIVGVDDISAATPVMSFGPDEFPDLARARELHPELTTLWDAVRRELWADLVSPAPLHHR
ncbi:hypothetical protein AB0L97_36625 [Nocardia sp. NPDC051911]|uniref:hypothetical protein n=1 Tax=Nocardia sp. NPDC051911 TaxID=3154648 RepID=UPI0034205F4A